MQKTQNNIRIVFMGTPEFAVGPLRALIDGGYNVVGVVTVPDKPSGRGLKINMSAVKEYVLGTGLQIPIMQPVRLKDPTFLEQLDALGADLFVVVAFRMLPYVVWSMPRLGTFNLHASLLPQYRGAAPINWAIINGETETGVTTFLLDEKIDTGAILFQEHIPILDSDTIGTLYDKLMSVGSQLVPRTVDALASNSVVGQAQPLSHLTLQSAPKLNNENVTIDWTKSAVEVRNLIRGLSPYPAAHTVMVQGDKSTEVKIFAAELCDANGKPGSVSTDGKKVFTVHCGEQSLNIQELQLAGKKRLAIRDFLAGFRGDCYFGANR